MLLRYTPGGSARNGSSLAQGHLTNPWVRQKRLLDYSTLTDDQKDLIAGKNLARLLRLEFCRDHTGPSPCVTRFSAQRKPGKRSAIR